MSSSFPFFLSRFVLLLATVIMKLIITCSFLPLEWHLIMYDLHFRLKFSTIHLRERKKMKSRTEKKMNYAPNCKYSISFADLKLPKEIWRLDLNSVIVTFPSSEECLHNFTSVCKKTAFFFFLVENWSILMRFTKLCRLCLNSSKWIKYFWEKPRCSQTL